MKILLLGKNGQVGWELQRSLAPLGTVLALDRYSADGAGDLSRPLDVAVAIKQFRPQFVVNAAAYTAVDKAETDAGTAQLINADAPGVLAEAARSIGAWFVHYSTDYVFDGSGNQPWSELDLTNPQNTYGRTKLNGEKAIVAVNDKHLIFRSSWVYATRGANFAKTMLRLAQERERLAIINDQIGAPTSAELIADVTALAICSLQHRSDDANLGGIYHLAAAGETSWFEYAKHVIATARVLRSDLSWKVNEIAPIPSSEYSTPARRPLNSRLSTEKLCRVFGLTMPTWSHGVDRMLSEHLS